MKVDGIDYRTVWFENGEVKMINQPLIPHKFEIVSYRDYRDVATAIRTMIVRGAPAIGASGAYGIALAAHHASDDQMGSVLFAAAAELRSTRPTAKDLFTGIDYVIKAIEECDSPQQVREVTLKRAQEYADKSAADCKKIGEYGNELIKDGDKILTHCNAGWLACVDWGTAPSVIYHAFADKKEIFVYVDETRPRCQGSRLTAWEMVQAGIPHKVIPDNAGAYYMSKDVSIVITGADRVALNGDAANKIGTYEKAIVAKELGIPFYIAAPLTTFDITCKTGSSIPIEERSEDEVGYMFGWSDSGEFSRVRIMPEGSNAGNPAFDVTPAKYITGIITEKGIIPATEEGVRSLFN